MGYIQFDLRGALPFLSERELVQMEQVAEAAKDKLIKHTGTGNDFHGWVDLLEAYDREEFARVQKAAMKIQGDSDVLVVTGIGGSYLGACATTEFLRQGSYDQLPKGEWKTPEIYFVGNNMSGQYMNALIDVIGECDFSVSVISKSGTTTETAISFRVFRTLLEKKYGKAGAASRIYTTTDKQRGALKQLADREGYECFAIPDDVGGRFSVLTAVGLPPIAVSGANISRLMEGAAAEWQALLTEAYTDNDAMRYAVARTILNRKGEKVEVLANYEPSLAMISEWWKQLFGESEGKDQKGILPHSVNLTTDLHSMGQYIQDDRRILMETALNVEQSESELVIREEAGDSGGLSHLVGEAMGFVCRNAMRGTELIHIDGGTPVMQINIPAQDEYSFGALFYFFEFAIGVSGYLLGVNPLDQSGVESYKRNMFAPLGKPGYERGREALLVREAQE